jgi:hypothetical protein
MMVHSPFSSRILLSSLLIVTGLGAAACASKAGVMRPKEQSAGEATGEKVCDPKRVAGDTEPFSVDWSDANRASLESAMSRGVAVVKYSCEGVEVLKGCSITGEYAYRGISKKTKVVQMKDMSEVSANLGPVSLPVAVQGEMKQGRGLDLAYALVGNESTTVQTVTRDMLKGRCDGATHFVYEAALGAFAMDTNASGEARGAAQVFGQGGVSTGASSAKSTRVTDGDVSACDKAKDEGREKVNGCKAVVRVTLFAIAPSVKATGPAIAAPDVRSCPDGFAYVDGSCKRDAKSTLCKVGDVDGCKALCTAGSAESCSRFSAALLERSLTSGFTVKPAARGDLTKQLAGFMDPLKKACEEGEGAACTGAAFASMAARPNADFILEGSDAKVAVPLFEKGCKQGDSTACYMSILVYGDGMLKKEGENSIPRDVQKMIDIVGLGCDRGNAVACFMLAGQIFYDDKSIPDAAARARTVVSFARRSCTGGIPEGCAAAGALQQPTAQCSETLKAFNPELSGKGEIFSLWKGMEDHCQDVASATNPEGAKEMFEVGCKLGHKLSCSRK